MEVMVEDGMVEELRVQLFDEKQVIKSPHNRRQKGKCPQRAVAASQFYVLVEPIGLVKHLAETTTFMQS